MADNVRPLSTSSIQILGVALPIEDGNHDFYPADGNPIHFVVRGASADYLFEIWGDLVQVSLFFDGGDDPKDTINLVSESDLMDMLRQVVGDR